MRIKVAYAEQNFIYPQKSTSFVNNHYAPLLFIFQFIGQWLIWNTRSHIRCANSILVASYLYRILIL